MARTVRFSNMVEEMCAKACVIEFQAFRDNEDKYIVKEMVILDLFTNVVYYFLFKPPYSLKKLNNKSTRTNKWLTNYFHHITWKEGFTLYQDLENVMYHFCNQFKKIYTTGHEKSKWIKQYTTAEVVNWKLNKRIEGKLSLFCDGVKDNRHRFSNCALLKAFRLATALSQTCTVTPTQYHSKDGGGEGYISESVPQTYHEYYSNLARVNN